MGGPVSKIKWRSKLIRLLTLTYGFHIHTPQQKVGLKMLNVRAGRMTAVPHRQACRSELSWESVKGFNQQVSKQLALFVA